MAQARAAPDAELVRREALRRPGRPALVLVRDDLMAATRFFQAIEVPIVQGRNSAAVELFDARHARKVLEGWAALGRIPADADGDPAAPRDLAVPRRRGRG
ncbi:MAG: hypothetical protein WKF75_02765 [Singulisphaera sp.]